MECRKEVEEVVYDFSENIWRAKSFCGLRLFLNSKGVNIVMENYMYRGNSMCDDIEKDLESVISENTNLSEESCRIILACLLEIFEKRSRAIFMEGYQYAISILEDGIVNKPAKKEK